MTLDATLAETYKQYKTGTSTFVQWLAQTASATGTVDDIFRSSEPAPTLQTGGGRLKGKARTEAKKMAATTTRPSMATVTVPVKHFFRLAVAIATSKHGQVPQTVLTILHSVIQGRKECAKWYQQNAHADETTRDQDGRHDHFIEILIQVYKILERAKIQTTPVVDVPAETHPVNRFEHLPVEEPFPSDEIEHSLELSVIPVENIQIRYQAEKSVEAESFAVFCLLKDSTDLRNYVQRTWYEYKSGKIALQTASFITNTACALLEKASDQFKQEFPHYESSERERPTMYNKVVTFLTQKYDAKFARVRRGEISTEDLSLEYETIPHMRMLETLCNHTATLAQSIFFLGDHLNLRLSADERRFAKTISQLAMVPKKTYPALCGDMTHKAAFDMSHEQRLDLWMVFVLQILWDTQRILDTTMPAARKALEDSVKDIKTKYESFLNTDGMMSMWDNSSYTQVQEVLQQLTFFFNDKSLRQYFDHFELAAPWKPVMCPRFFLLDNQPTFCGRAVLELYHNFHVSCTMAASHDGLLLATAHLYNAAKVVSDDFKDMCWDDLDWFITKQGVAWMYVGSQPKRVSDLANRLNMVLGAKSHKHMQWMRRDRALTDMKLSKAIPRWFTLCATYSEIKTEQDKTTKFIKHDSNISDDLTSIASRMVQSLNSKKIKATTPNSMQTLDSLKLVVEKDVVALSFDLMGLYLRCYKLLRKLRSYCWEHAPRDFPKTLGSVKFGMQTVVTEMFNYMSVTPGYERSMFPQALCLLRETIEEGKNSALIEMDIKTKKMYLQNVDKLLLNSGLAKVPPEQSIPFQRRASCPITAEESKDGVFRAPPGTVQWANGKGFEREDERTTGAHLYTCDFDVEVRTVTF